MQIHFRVWLVNDKRYLIGEYKTMEAALREAEKSNALCTIRKIRTQVVAGWNPKTGIVTLKK